METTLMSEHVVGMVPSRNRIFLPTTNMMHVIEPERIVRVQSISNYSKLFFNNGKTLVVAKLLRWFEENLPAQDFARVHRTHLVNMNYVSRFKSEQAERSLMLSNGEEIDVSKRRKHGFLKILQSRT